MVPEPLEDYFSSIWAFIHRIGKIVSFHFLNDPGGGLLCRLFNVCYGTGRWCLLVYIGSRQEKTQVPGWYLGKPSLTTLL